MKKLLYNGRYETAKTVNFVKKHSFCAKHRNWYKKEITCAKCAEIAQGKEILWQDNGGHTYSAIVIELLNDHDVKILWNGQEQMLPEIANNVKIAGLDY